MIRISLKKLTVIILSLILSACGEELPRHDKYPVPLTIKQKWDGVYPFRDLSHLPDGQQELPVGYINNRQELEKIWRYFKPGQTAPDMDFDHDMIVYSRNVDFFNRISIFKADLQDGTLEILTQETMSSLPVTDSVAISFIVIPADGIKFIKSGERRLVVPVKD
jgi:hypothetical protein